MNDELARRIGLPAPLPAEPPRRRAWVRLGLVALFAAAAGVAAFATMLPSGAPTPPTEIYQGIVYECIELDGVEARGAAHIVTVDLDHPGIDLYTTPLDARAAEYGFQYRLTHGESVVAKEQLAVLVNGALFDAEGDWIPLAGEWANGSATVVSDHQISHVDPHSYLLWFDDDLTPHVETKKPPSAAALRQARWGISGKSVPLRDGKIPRRSKQILDGRTVLAVDPASRRLWIAAFESASAVFALQMLADRGATWGLAVDGGDSTTMVLGAEAAGVRTGVVLGGRRPVATFFGVRALPVQGND